MTFCGTTSAVDTAWLSLISKYMEFIWYSVINLWQWHQTSQIMFPVSQIVGGPGPQLLSCDLLISAACQMGFQVGWDADLSYSTRQICPSHLQPGAKDILYYCGTDCRQACPAWHGPSGGGVLSGLAGSWKDEGLIKWRWMCHTACIDRVQVRQFQLLHTTWKPRFSFSVRVVLAPVCCYWYTR